MRYLIHLLLALVTAIATGFGLSYAALEQGVAIGTLRVGPWVAWPESGSPAPDPYTRAFIARTGGLQLSRAEGLRFTARTDSDGEVLSLDCSYRIDGETPAATFWTLTATDLQGQLLTTPGHRKVLHSGRIARQDDGSAVLRVGAQISEGNWLEIEGEGEFEIVLTIYDSPIFSGLGALQDALPTITRESCRS